MDPQENKGNNCNLRRYDLERITEETRVTEFREEITSTIGVFSGQNCALRVTNCSFCKVGRLQEAMSAN